MKIAFLWVFASVAGVCSLLAQPLSFEQPEGYQFRMCFAFHCRGAAREGLGCASLEYAGSMERPAARGLVSEGGVSVAQF